MSKGNSHILIAIRKLTWIKFIQSFRPLQLPSFFFLFTLVLSSLSCYLTAGEEAKQPEGPPKVQARDPWPTIKPSTVYENDCTHFVSPNGSDESEGGQDRPWASFEKAALQASAGDVVCFFGGTYPTDTIRLTASGEPDEMISFIANPGQSPVLDGQGQVGELLILTAGVSHVHLSGFTLRNFNGWGIELSGENRHILFDHLDIHGGEASVRFTYGESEEQPREGPVEDVLIEDSLFQGSEFTALDCTPGPCNRFIFRRLEVIEAGLSGADSYGADGIAFSRGRDILIEDCNIHDNGGDGIDLNSRDREGNVSGIVVARNRVVRNHLNGIKVWAGGRIENNEVWGQGNSALWVGTWDSNIEIVNNTIAYNMWDDSYSGRNWVLAAGYPEEDPRPEVNLTLVNNIFAFNADPLEGGPVGIYLGPGVQLTEGYNLFYSRPEGEISAEYLTGHDTDITRQEIADGTWQSLSGNGGGDLIADPLFLSGWPDVDLRLGPGSPAIDSCDPGYAPSVDLDGQPRQGLPDLGAYEMR